MTQRIESEALPVESGELESRSELAIHKVAGIPIGAVIRSVAVWMKAAVNLPVVLADIQTQLRMKSGEGLTVWADRIDQNIFGMRQLMTSETALRRASMQHLDVAIYEAGADGHWFWANNQFLFEGRCKLDEIRGENWANLIAMPDRERIVDGWEDAVQRGTNFKAKFRLNTDEVPERWMAFDTTCNKDESGQTLGFLGYMREIKDPTIHTTA